MTFSIVHHFGVSWRAVAPRRADSERASQVRERVTCRIVICDDNDVYRSMMCMVLELDRRFDVVGQAIDGRQAIEVCREQQPDIVLLDIAMPIMDGIEALPEIRRECPASRILMNSAFLESSVGQQCLDRGANGYVEKGVELAALLDTLARASALEARDRL